MTALTIEQQQKLGAAAVGRAYGLVQSDGGAMSPDLSRQVEAMLESRDPDVIGAFAMAAALAQSKRASLINEELVGIALFVE